MSQAYAASFGDLIPPQIEGLGEQIRGQIGAGGAGLAWPLVETEALGGLRRVLGQVDLGEQLARAWVTLKAIGDLRGQAQSAKGETVVVPLGPHELALEATPQLQLTIAGVKAPPLRLTYGVALAFDTASLSVRDGALVAALPGDCAATVTLSCGATPLHDPWTLAKVNLPGPLEFSPGWKIP